MSIELTNEQQKQIDATKDRPAEVVDPRGHRRYKLVPAEEYESLQDDRDQASLRKDALHNLASRLQEDA